MDSAGISEPLSTGLPPLGEVRSAAVRQLLPSLVDPVTPLDLYPFDARHRDDGRPWVMMNMVASADGAIAIDGRSGGLGGDGDREVFRAIRASCDWIVVAAGTVRAERYGIPRTTAEIATVRRRAGRMPAPRLAVVSGTLDLDPGLPLFADRRPHEEPPLLITGPSPHPERVAALDDHVEWARVAEARPGPRTILDTMGDRGASVVLVEGGPTFNAQLVDAGGVDELCLSISPHLVGGPSTRIVSGSATDSPSELRLDRLLEHDGALFARYLRA